jgi:hypothetical protein
METVSKSQNQTKLENTHVFVNFLNVLLNNPWGKEITLLSRTSRTALRKGQSNSADKTMPWGLLDGQSICTAAISLWKGAAVLHQYQINTEEESWK